MKTGVNLYFREKSEKLLSSIDLPFLLFLLLLLNYRFSFKLVALAGIYMLRPRVSYRMDGITVFYLAMPALGVLSYMLHGHSYGNHYLPVLLVCSLIWLGCFFAYLQVRHAVATQHPLKTANTLKALAAINCLISFFDFAKVVRATGTMNPFTQESSPPYGISSGDLIGGVFGEMHLVNTVATALLLYYFVSRKEPFFAALCLVPFLLTGSNLATIITCAAMIALIIAGASLQVKYFACCVLTVMVLYYERVTPHNYAYMGRTIAALTAKQGAARSAGAAVQPPSSIVPAPEKEKTKDELIREYLAYRSRGGGHRLPGVTAEQRLVANSFVKAKERERAEATQRIVGVISRRDSVQNRKKRSEFFEYGRLRRYDLQAEAGKVTSFRQTAAFVTSDWRLLLAGGGPASFSSRMAFIASRIVADSRLLQFMPAFETSEFRNNHKSIFKYLMFLDDASHSITNLPFSWYNTVISEYGLAGTLCFLVLYCGTLIRRLRWKPAALIIFCSMAAFLLFDYWFERLSVMVLFEMILLLCSREEKLTMEPGT